MLTALLAGCPAHKVLPPPVDLDTVEISESGTAEVPDRWWVAFADPRLDALVDEALGNNLDVRAAFARLTAAEAVVRQGRAPLFPEADAWADATLRSDDNSAPIEIGVRASYEVDLWGRIRNELKADVARREATRADARSAALSLSAEVARTWVAIAATREQIALLDEQITANEEMVAVVDARFRYGVVRQADALRQERLLEATHAQRIVRQEDLEVLEHRLAVLLGRAPMNRVVDPPDALPALPELPAAGVPLDLVQRRPDVRAAEHHLMAADREVAAAVAAQFPQLSLTGSVSNVPTSPEAVLTGWIASLTAGLLAPLFEGGRRRAEVKRTRAVLEEELALYGAAVLTALQEVEDALARNRRQEELVASLDRQVDLADRTAAGLWDQYAGGMEVGYLDVLTAQANAQQLERELIGARHRQLQLRIDLYRALAGGVEPPEEAGE